MLTQIHQQSDNTSDDAVIDMELTQPRYTFSQLKELADEDIYQYLFKHWDITTNKIEVWGRIEEGLGTIPYRLQQVRLVHNNKIIEYPIKVVYPLTSGIYVSPAVGKKYLGSKHYIYIRGELKLAPKSERLRHENPLELNLASSEIERLQKLPIEIGDDVLGAERVDNTIVLNADTEYFISEILYKQQIKKLSEKLETSTAAASAKLSELQESNEHEKSIKEQLNIAKQELQQNINQQQNELLALNKLYQGIEQEMKKKVEKLKSYISQKAVFLKNFEFIDEDVFDSFIFDVVKERDTSDMVSFSSVLEGDYKRAVSYIQAYLKKRDILYSRHIIENYLTLIRSNDLIILAGDSGSGKTNLVNSFAEAVGGVSKIIPVKPNWTSSEDLLGYYNPLEKKYLATPFLEALIEAQQNPEVPYFICLDEMNLARVEYYFADFLSKLEERKAQPIIELYSDDEASHVLSELKGVNAVITAAQDKYNQGGISDFVGLMTDENVNAEIRRAFGFSEKESLIKYHGEIRRMLAGIINTPSSITIPQNVRIIGAVNIDETTHYLSPKILDRAHIMKFKSPLLSDWDSILEEIDTYGFTDVTKPLLFAIDELGVREPYPKYDGKNEFCALFKAYNRDYFHPLGVEFGMRTIRQGLNYLELFKDVNDDHTQAINNFIIHKVLPKFTFDGDKKSGDMNKLQRVSQVFHPELEKLLNGNDGEFSAHIALSEIIDNAENNDSIVNYWA